MFMVFSTIIMFLVLQTTHILAFKPNFDYCSQSSICEEACSCSSEKCLLLPMDDTTREDILLHHNRIRNLQTKNLPQPSGLALLEYDPELEDVSSCWASRCEAETSDCFYTPNFSGVSQTVGQIILEEDDLPNSELWIQIMNTWLVILEELPLEMLYTKNENIDISEHNLAQLLSDRILYVGCAWGISNSWIFFVCSYGPRGPKPGGNIYRIGDTCSTCPDDYMCSYMEPFDTLCKSIFYREVERLEEHAKDNKMEDERAARRYKKKFQNEEIQNW